MAVDMIARMMAMENGGGGGTGDAYTKAETDALLDEKADKSTTYTKAESDTLFSAKVDKVSGKGLSTNDYTNTDKANLAAAIEKANAAAPQSTTYTKTEVEAALSGKQPTLTTAQQEAVDSGITAAKVQQYDKDSAALIQQVDGGAKNLFNHAASYALDNLTNNDGVYTTVSDTLTTLRLQIAKQLNGTNVENLVLESIYNNSVYYWEFTKYSSFNAFMIGHNGSSENARFKYALEKLTNGQKYVISIDITRCSDSGGSFQWRDIMICTAEDWAISHKFVPYAPTNRELYEMILAMQNGG